MRLTLLAPAFLAGAALAALAVVALHFLAVGRPPRRLLPTARFVPASSAVASSLTRRPTDRALLSLRVLALLLAGLALAGPALLPARAPVVRVIVADRSRAVRDPADVARRVRALAREGDLVVAFDSAPRAPLGVGATGDAPARDAVDSLLAPRAAGAWWTAPRGSLSVALVAAVRAAGTLRERADSVELVIVSPLAGEEVDAATARIRGAWPGRARVERVAASTGAPARGAVDVRDAAGRAAATDDAVSAAVALLGAATPAARDTADGVVRRADVRLVRAARPGAADSAWLAAATEVAPRTLVVWPPDGAPAGWTRLDRADSLASAVEAGGAAIVAPLARAASVGSSAGGRVVARWADGAPAAVERARAGGCLREVGIAVPDAGDAALSTPFRDVLAALIAPCGAPFALAAADDLTGPLVGSGALAPARAFGAATAARDARWPRWLLAASLALLLVELLVRRGCAPSAALPADRAHAPTDRRVQAA